MSIVWLIHNSPPSKKAKALMSIGKVMCVVLKDIRGGGRHCTHCEAQTPGECILLFEGWLVDC